MTKAKKTQYGIEITKPWSKEMYAHNEDVMEAAKEQICKMWEQAYNVAEEEYEREMQTDRSFTGISGVHYEEFGDIEWVEGKTEFLDEIQRVVTCYGFGFGFDMNTVFESVQEELENAPYYRVNEMVEELGIELEKGFVGFD
jgi:hypothetical protein